MTGLLGGYDYGVFWSLEDDSYSVEATPTATHMASSEYVFLGWQQTASGSGSYTPSPTPPGGYGGTGRAADNR